MQKGLRYLGGIAQVLGEDMADSLPLSHSLPQVGQLTSLCLDQRVVLPVKGGTAMARERQGNTVLTEMFLCL